MQALEINGITLTFGSYQALKAYVFGVLGAGPKQGATITYLGRLTL